jgi:hypothetical protein
MATSIARTMPESPSRRGLRHHAIAYALVMALLVAINVVSGAPYWVLWVAVGWGMGIALHAFLALRR